MNKIAPMERWIVEVRSGERVVSRRYFDDFPSAEGAHDRARKRIKGHKGWTTTLTPGETDAQDKREA